MRSAPTGNPTDQVFGVLYLVKTEQFQELDRSKGKVTDTKGDVSLLILHQVKSSKRTPISLRRSIAVFGLLNGTKNTYCEGLKIVDCQLTT